MSDPETTDEQAALQTARRAARQAARAAQDLATFTERLPAATFTERLPAVLDPALRAEYAALLARDEETRAQREDALAALDLTIPSIDGDQ